MVAVVRSDALVDVELVLVAVLVVAIVDVEFVLVAEVVNAACVFWERAVTLG